MKKMSCVFLAQNWEILIDFGNGRKGLTINRDLPKVSFLAEAEGRSRRCKNFGLRPKTEAEGTKIEKLIQKL